MEFHFDESHESFMSRGKANEKAKEKAIVFDIALTTPIYIYIYIHIYKFSFFFFAEI